MIKTSFNSLGLVGVLLMLLSFDYATNPATPGTPTFITPPGLSQLPLPEFIEMDPEAPAAQNDFVQTVVDQTVYIYPMKNDEMNGEMMDFGIHTQPAYGEVGLYGERFVYIPEKGICGETDQFAYYVTNPNGTAIGVVEIQILCDDLVAYSGFSPNGDGYNDQFKIEGIHKYPHNKVTIFNRWGNQVFFKYQYSNDLPWEGTFDGEDVPSGTYFYVIDNGEGRKYSGYVEVVR